MGFDYDLLVIGAGSGGLAAAERAAGYGARVAIAEKTAIGGTCVNHGCVPEKLMNYAADFAEHYQTALSYGWSPVQCEFDWTRFIQVVNQRIEALQQLHQHHLNAKDVTLIEGQVTFRDPHTLVAGDRQITAAKILISTGATWDKPDIPGIEQAITSREFFRLARQPKTVAVIGGGYIGTKSASSLALLGSQVIQVVPEERILTAFDHEIAAHVQAEMAERGVTFYCDSHLGAIESTSMGLQLTFAERPTPLMVDTVLLTSRRQANLSYLNLDQVGVKTTPQGTIAVDQYSRTTQPHIFAVGDCTSHPPLTPVAIAAARAFADTEFGQHPCAIDYHLLPVALSAQPEAASVGLSETQAKERFGEAVTCYRAPVRSLYHCLTQSPATNFLKLVTEPGSHQIVGAHMVGQGAIEIIQCLAIALRKGMTRADLAATIGLHPSVAEGFIELSA